MEPDSATPTTLDRQVQELVARLDALGQRMMLSRPAPAMLEVECSHQGMKALMVLGRRGALTMSELASVLDMPLSTATHTVDKLVDKELVGRVRLPDNRRVVQVELSEKGRQMHNAFLQGRLVMARTMLESLSAGEREIFLELIAKISRPLEAPVLA
jgi:DNA-binding MarR family transcriptional regulator